MNTSKLFRAGRIVLIIGIIYAILRCIVAYATDLGDFTQLDVVRMILNAVPGFIGMIVGIILMIVGRKNNQENLS